MGLLVRWAALAAAVWITTLVVPGIDVDGGLGSYLWIALVFGLVNATVGNLARLLSLPFVILTLGLGLLVINAAMLALTAALTSALTIDGVLAAFLGALLITVVSSVLSGVGKRAVGR